MDALVMLRVPTYTVQSRDGPGHPSVRLAPILLDDRRGTLSVLGEVTYYALGSGKAAVPVTSFSMAWSVTVPFPP